MAKILAACFAPGNVRAAPPTDRREQEEIGGRTDN